MTARKLGGEMKLSEKQFQRNCERIKAEEQKRCKERGHTPDASGICTRCGDKA